MWGTAPLPFSPYTPAPHFPTPKFLSKRPKREDDGREGAISGRLARKATGVSPSGFARTGVLAGKLPQTVLIGRLGRSTAPRTRFLRRPVGAFCSLFSVLQGGLAAPCAQALARFWCFRGKLPGHYWVSSYSQKIRNFQFRMAPSGKRSGARVGAL